MLTLETLTIFVLSCFVGYYVVLKVTPALHAPLMSVTNAISSVIIVVAIDAGVASSYYKYLNDDSATISSWFGICTILLMAINIFGGFAITRRMLKMFSSKKKKGE